MKRCDCLLICLSIKQLTPNLNAQEFDYEGGESWAFFPVQLFIHNKSMWKFNFGDDDDDDDDDDNNGNSNEGYGCIHHNLLLLCMYQWHFTKHITVSCLYYRPPKEVACLILLLAATATHCYYYCNVAVRVSLEYIRLKTSAVVQTYNTVHFFKSIL
ncbi:hypothetical protein GQX74_003975 [Glossina fuscipes]|nr:hypothetical protein GQX74_003975 [Glossina fuscipes]